jgi:DNA-binding CsgD family transcriptional regulator
MRDSAPVRDSDFRAMLRLAGEAGELPPGSRQRRLHLLDGVRRLVGGQSSLMFLLGPGAGRGPLTDAPVFMTASMPAGQQAAFEHLIRYNPPPRNPIVPLLLRNPAPLLTQHRRQVAPERTWFHSDFYNEFLRPKGLDDVLYVKVPVPGGRTLALAVLRGAGDQPFGDRECRLADLFHEEAGRLYGIDAPTPADLPIPRGPAMLQTPGVSDGAAPDGRLAALPPRLRPVLSHLLDGQGEKQVAIQLGLSRHTVHEYVKALYRKLNVSSRGELMAQFVRRPVGAGLV